MAKGYISNRQKNLKVGISSYTENQEVLSVIGKVGIGTVIDIVHYDTQNNGTLSWEASEGTLFSISNNLSSGSIFSVNPISGIPIIDVNADRTIALNPYGGNTGIGTTNPTSKLSVVGDGNFTGVVTASSFSGNASSATYATSAGIATYSTTSGVSTSVSGGIASVTQLNVSGVSTFQGDVYLGDNDSLYFGDGNDLRIYHNGTDSIIQDVGTGNLYLGSNGSRIEISKFYGTEPIARFNVDSSVELYYDNLKKFETTGAGATVFGTLETQQLNVSGVSTFGGNVNLGDNDKIILGDGGDLEIFHDTSNSRIRDTGTGDLSLEGQNVIIKNAGSLASMADFTANSSVSLYFNGSKKFETISTGVTITNDLYTSGNVSVAGTIFENFNGQLWNVVTQADVGYGASQVPLNQYLGQLAFLDDYHPNGLRRDGGGSDDVTVNDSGFVGIGTTNATATLDVRGDVNVTGVSTFGGNVYLGDNDSLYFGDGNDLQIYHDGTNSIIDNTTGNLIIRNTAPGNVDSSIFIRARSDENSIIVNDDGSVELYYDNSKKFETTGAGATVFGTLETQQLNVSGVSTFQGNVYLGDNDILNFGADDDLQIFHDGSNSIIKDNGTGGLVLAGDGTVAIRNAAGNENKAIFSTNGAVELYYDNSKKFETTDYGIYVTGAGNTSTIGGAANLVLDPSTVGDNTGTVTILGNLQVEGTQTIINSTTLEVDDKLVSIAKSATNATQADGAGLEINGASATLTYASTGDKWVFNKAPYYNTDRILTTADEGSGNGLDADTVDGIQASSFLRSDADDITTGQIQITKANNTANGGGQLYLNGAIGNRIDFNTNGVAAPTFTTRSAGTKIVLYPSIDGDDVDYAFGIENATLWYSIPSTFGGRAHRWYAGTTQLADLKGTGELVIGSTSLTGTSNQKLQVNGGAYVSGNLGIGTTNPLTQLHLSGFNTNNSNLKIGSLEFQNYSLNNSFFGDNVYWNGSAMVRRSTGYAGLFYFFNDEGQFRLSPVGAANSETNNNPQLKINSNGGFAIGSSLSQNTNNFTGANFYVNPNGIVMVGTISSTGTANQKLQVNGGAYVSGDVGVGVTNPASNTQVAIAGTLGISEVGGSGTRTLFTSGGNGFYLNHTDNSNIHFQSQSSTKLLYRLSDNNWSTPSGVGLLVGTGAITGTANQKLQVNGGAYVSGSLGIGVTNPTNTLTINGANNDTTPILGLRSGNIALGINDGAQISFGYDGTDDYQHFIQTRHNSGNLNNAIDFYVCDGTQNNTLTSGSIHTMSLVSGSVGINTTNPQYKLHVIGSFAATTKSFVIDHPTKEGMKLRYGSLEGPENGVYVRGRLKGNNTIELPEYWTNLVDEDSITVNLTPIGRKAPLHSVIDIVDNTVVVESASGDINCFYTVFAERKDVEKLEVEF